VSLYKMFTSKKLKRFLCFPFQALASSFQRTFILYCPNPLSLLSSSWLGVQKYYNFLFWQAFWKKILFYFFRAVFDRVFRPSLLALYLRLNPVNLLLPFSVLLDELVPVYNLFVVFGSAKINSFLLLASAFCK